MAPKHAHVPEPGNCLIYMAKGTFVDMIKLRNLSQKNNPGLSGWVQCKLYTGQKEEGLVEPEKEINDGPC